MGCAPIRVRELAAELGRSFDGDGEFLIAGVAALESAGPGDLSFVRSPSFARLLPASGAGALIAPPGIEAGARPVIRSPEPGLDFARATRRIVVAEAARPGVHPSARLAPDARVDPTASVGPNCCIGSRAAVGPRTVIHANATLYEGVRVGADCVVHAGCVVREGCVLGDRVILQPGVVLGGDGFGYVADAEGELEKVPQVGRVVLEDDVEIGANTTVDRGTLGETRIGRGAKIDNLVQVGHNCSVGPRVIVISQAGLSGSARVEAGAVVMAQAGLNGHLTVGERAVVGPQCGVHKDVPPRTRVLGSPQRDFRVFQRMMSALPRLPALLRRVRALERRLGIDPGAAGPPGD